MKKVKIYLQYQQLTVLLALLLFFRRIGEFHKKATERRYNMT